MPLPTLRELPPPPPGRTGWPWTEETPPVPAEPAPGKAWPRISIVTPSYNQGRYIEETIRSVLLQGYPDVEYIVMDGGSTDETVDILRKYERWLTFWVSEPDRGQTHAIAKGVRRSTGQVFNWLNSDDFFAPGALAEVGRFWVEESPHLLIGRGVVLDVEDRSVVHDWYGRRPHEPLDLIRSRAVISQPSAFIDVQTLHAVGGLREDLHFIMDWEFYLRITAIYREELRVPVTRALLSYALSHPDTKTNLQSKRFREESKRVLRELLPRLLPRERLRLRLYLRRLDNEDRISDALATPGEALRSLLGIALRSPNLLGSRFFWGAVRRAVQA